MKRLALILFASAILPAFADVTVTFRNDPATLDPSTDRLVRFGTASVGGISSSPASTFNPALITGLPVTSNIVDGISDLRVQFLYGPAAGGESSLISVQAPPTTFRPSTSIWAGAWFTAGRTLPGFDHFLNPHLLLQVVVWQSSQAVDWASASSGIRDGTYSGLAGASIPFTFDVPEPIAPPSDYLINNFEGFSVGWFGSEAALPVVPEPGCAAIGFLGLSSFLLVRRRHLV